MPRACANTGDQVDRPQIPLSSIRVPVDATDNMESNGAATDAAGHQPKKKQRRNRKPPPTNNVVNVSEESSVPAPMGASVHGSEILRETRLARRTEINAAAMPRQMQFIFSPRLNPQNSVAPETGERFPRSDILQRGHPIGHSDTGYFHGLQRNETDSVSAFSSSMGTASLALNHAATAASRQQGTLNVNFQHRLGPGDASGLSPLLPTMLEQQLMRGVNVSDLFRFPVDFMPHIGNQDIHMARIASQSRVLSNSGNSARIPTLSQLHPRNTASQTLEDILRMQQGPQPHTLGFDTVHGGSGLNEQRRDPGLLTGSTVVIRLPVTLSQSTDSLHLNPHQVYLREQIEVFEATEDDLYANTRGRNKKIHVGQVGVRCRHCANIPANFRQSGAVYFPGTMRGLYQAAQNMSTNHIQCGLCTEMPDCVKTKFVELLPSKNIVSRVGQRYWEESARPLGLVDTEDGIAFQPDTGA